jgi:hypothetical protein
VQTNLFRPQRPTRLQQRSQRFIQTTITIETEIKHD